MACETPASSLNLPPGSWDTHFHIFPSEYPLGPSPVFVPPRFPNAVAESFHSSLGVQRTVLVHSFAFGTDQSSMYDFVGLGAPGTRRAIGIVADDATDEEIRAMDKAGVRGVRGALGGAGGGAESKCEGLRVQAEKLDKAGVKWCICIQDPDPEFWLVVAEKLKTFPPSQTIMIDHMTFLSGPWSRPSPRLVTPLSVTPDIAAIISLLQTPSHSVYFKLSAPYRLTSEMDTLEPLVKELAKAAEDRLVWGSDWPHTPLTADVKKMKDEGRGGDMIELRQEDDAGWLSRLKEWTGEKVFKKIMVDNPTKLYG